MCIAILLNACEKNAPSVSTIATTDITHISATSGGNVTDEGDGIVSARGVVWGKADPTIESNDGLSSEGSGAGIFTCNLTGLEPYTDYIIKAFATNKFGTTYGLPKTFKTLAQYADIMTLPATVLTDSSFVANGIIADDGGADVTGRGFYLSTNNVPEINGTKIPAGNGSGTFTAQIRGLSAGTAYYIKAYAVNVRGERLGEVINISTPNGLPRLVTTDPSDVLTTTAKAGGTISDDGGLTISEKGVYYSTNSNPAVYGTRIAAGTGTTPFTVNLYSLALGTKYYFVAYARNSQGTGYGKVKSFTTQTTKPVVNTSTPSGIAPESATVGGVVTSEGGKTVTDRGIYWSTSNNPESTGTKVSTGNGPGSFSTTLSGLAPQTTYYVKAYAVNSNGESLGSQVIFNTDSYTSPVVFTTTPYSVTENSAITGGNITSDGHLTVTDRGIYWGATADPETSGTKVSAGTGTGVFASTLSGLALNTTYYIKAYAVNSLGESLGVLVSFKTGFTGLTGEKIFNPGLTYGSVSDIEGNSYKTIVIGSQTWFAENLKTATYNDGNPIPYIVDNTAWIATTSAAFSWYNNNVENKELMGGKYNWWVVETGKICPSGWHVPSDFEWSVLMEYLGGNYVAGGKVKETGLTHWNAPNTGATNSSGFTSLPGGSRREADGSFFGIGSYDCWWSVTEWNYEKAWYRSNNAVNTEIFQSSGAKKISGMAIRCIKD